MSFHKLIEDPDYNDDGVLEDEFPDEEFDETELGEYYGA
jgi:hypothetical protein